MVYVDGQNDDDWSEDGDAEMQDSVKAIMPPQPKARKSKTSTKLPTLDGDGESDEDLPNGVAQEIDEGSEDGRRPH